jgi:hypothetical protein
MSTQVAFALKAGYDLDSVGSVFVNNQTDVNVRAELGDADGVLVTDDPQVIAVLDGYEQLKRVSAPDIPLSPEQDGLDELTREKLLDLPEAANVEGAKSMRVDDLRAAVRAERNQEEK